MKGMFNIPKNQQVHIIATTETSTTTTTTTIVIIIIINTTRGVPILFSLEGVVLPRF